MKKLLVFLLLAGLLAGLALPALASQSTVTFYGHTEDGYCGKDLSTGIVVGCDDTAQGMRMGVEDSNPDYAYRVFTSVPFSGDWMRRSIVSADYMLTTYGGSTRVETDVLILILNPFPLGTNDWNAGGYLIADNWPVTSSWQGYETTNTLNIKDVFTQYKNTTLARMDFRLTRATEPSNTTNYFDAYSTDICTPSCSQQPRIAVTYAYDHVQNVPSGVTTSTITVNWNVSGALDADDRQEVWYIASQNDPGWNDNPGANGWSLSGPAAWNATSHTITGLQSQTRYWLRVRDLQWTTCPADVCSQQWFPGSVSTSRNIWTN